MPTPDEESRLEQTKMSFGEHLEELRSALVKSLVALVIGSILGLCIGFPLVDYIQEPLRRALREHYLARAEAKQLAWLQARQDAGFEVPKNLKVAAKEAVRRGGIPHDYFVAADELAASLEPLYPELAKVLRDKPAEDPGAKPPTAQADAEVIGQFAAPEGMLRLRLYEPIEDEARLNTIATDAFEPMVVYIKASFAAGLVFASPFIFYFMWQFVAAGLYRTEKQYVHVYLPLSLGLFLIGAALAYYFAFDYMLTFLFWVHEKMGIEPYPKLSDWITTVVLMPLGFGVSFQLPLVMLLLQRIGVFSIESYWRKWRIAVVVIAIASMVLTPGSDISSMLLMFVPLTGLYFLGIVLCTYMPGGSIRSPLRDILPKKKPPGSKPEDSAGS
jgi:sec-independent protein translocase protein TatC